MSDQERRPAWAASSTASRRARRRHGREDRSAAEPALYSGFAERAQGLDMRQRDRRAVRSVRVAQRQRRERSGAPRRGRAAMFLPSSHSRPAVKTASAGSAVRAWIAVCGRSARLRCPNAVCGGGHPRKGGRGRGQRSAGAIPARQHLRAPAKSSGSGPERTAAHQVATQSDGLNHEREGAHWRRARGCSGGPRPLRRCRQAPQRQARFRRSRRGSPRSNRAAAP